jgi:hypothetical protein
MAWSPWIAMEFIWYSAPDWYEHLGLDLFVMLSISDYISAQSEINGLYFQFFHVEIDLKV